MTLTNVLLGNGVTNIQMQAFAGCPNLAGIYMLGNAPGAGANPFAGDNTNAIVYYLPGATGWGAQLGGVPTRLWLPQMQAGINSGMPLNQFGFNVNWASGQTVVVEACTNLTIPVWVPVATNLLTGSTCVFQRPAIHRPTAPLLSPALTLIGAKGYCSIFTLPSSLKRPPGQSRGRLRLLCRNLPKF